MSDEASEMPVGWEVWLLLVLLTGGGLVVLLIFALVAGGLEPSPPSRAALSRPLPVPDLAHTTVGTAGSAVLTGLALLAARADRIGERGPGRPDRRRGCRKGGPSKR